MNGEYRILQDKLDKIGAFRFTIRGWSITLVVASIFGAATAKLPTYYGLLGLIFILLTFFLMELAQKRHGHTFSRRLAKLERRIWGLLRTASSDSEVFEGGMIPRIAHEIEDERKARWKLMNWLDSHGYWFFYGVQAVLIVVVVLLLERTTEFSMPDKDTTVNFVTNGETRPTAERDIPASQKTKKTQKTH